MGLRGVYHDPVPSKHVRSLPFTPATSLAPTHPISTGVRRSIASLIYITNPLFSFFLSPLIGSASDAHSGRCGKRAPFIALLALAAQLSMLLLVCSPLTGSRSVQAVVCFLGYTIFDCAHDLILVPGRALVSDMQPDDQATDAQYTLFQLLGRLLGLLAGAVSLEDGLPGSLSHFQAVMIGAMVVLAVCCSISIGVSGPSLILSTTLLGDQTRLTQSTDDAKQDDPISAGIDCDAGSEQLLEAEADHPLEEEGWWFQSEHRLPLTMLLLGQLSSWIMINLQSFWWTYWVSEILAYTCVGCASHGCCYQVGVDTALFGSGLRLGFSSLALQALVGVCFCGVAPKLAMVAGTVRIWLGAKIIMSASLVAVLWVPSDSGLWVMVIAGCSGVEYASNSTLVHSVCQSIVCDPNRRGYLIGLASNAMCVAQLLVAGFAGVAVDAFEGDVKYLFASTGLLSMCVTLIIIVADYMLSIFPRMEPSEVE